MKLEKWTVNEYKLPDKYLWIEILPVVSNNELPHRIVVDVGGKKIQAAAITLAGAITRGLHMAGFPRVDRKELARILFWRYGPPYPEWWKDAIGALEKGV